MEGLKMMLQKRGGALMWLLVAAAMLTCTVSRLFTVGDGPGWTPNVNYTDWASHQHIFVGDWLCE